MTTDISWGILEERFGKRDNPITNQFRNQYFNGIAGWQFPKEIIKEANTHGKLLTMDLDIPGNKCKLNCTYCFAKAGEQTGTYYRPDKGETPLTVDEIKFSLIEAKNLGLESAKIIGYREPFDNQGIYEFISFATKKGIQLVIFTSGYTLGENEFKGDVEKAIDFLAKNKVSLMIKMHTLDIKKEDSIVRKKGYSKTRNLYLNLLLKDRRFTSSSPTRLGIENVLSSQNLEELLAIYEYFKIYQNVFVDLDPPIPIGRTGTLKEAENAGLMSQDKLMELCVKTYQINQKYSIPFEGISPYFGGNPCSQLPNGLYLTLSGKVLTCCGGDEKIGDIKERSLGQIFKDNPYRKKNMIFHSCPYRNKKGIMTTEFIQKARDKLKSDFL